jgi:hypothetical protein
MNDSNRSGIDAVLPTAYKLPVYIDGYRVWKADGNNSQTVIQQGDEMEGQGSFADGWYITAFALIDDPQDDDDLDIVQRGDGL